MSNQKTIVNKFSEFLDDLIEEGPAMPVKDGIIISDNGKLITAEQSAEEWHEQMMLLQVLNAVRIAHDDGTMHEIYFFMKNKYPYMF